MNIKKVKSVLLVLIACIIAYFFLLPILFMVFTSFKSLSEGLSSSRLLPHSWTFNNYTDLFNNVSSSPILRWFANTMIVTVSGTFLRLFISLLASYALSRLNVPFKNFFVIAIIWAMAIPEIVTFFPMFYMFKAANMLNQLMPLILPSGANALTVYLIYNFLKSFPKALEEAAYIDGASTFKVLTSVILPNIKPIIVTQGFITFLYLYNTYLWPSLIINRTETRTLTIGVAALVLGENYVNPGLMMAATVVAVLPVVIIFMFANKYIVANHTQAGIK